MLGTVFVIQVIVYSLTLWFGLYLLGRSGGLRSSEKPGLSFAGLGLIAYAIGLGAASVSPYAADTISVWYSLLALLPACFWFGAAWSLLPNPPHLPANGTHAPWPELR